jgi:tetratricopeptide (TPR) repeat protein
MAIATLRRGLEISKDDPVLLNDLGMCHLLRNEPDQAIDCFKQAVAASPRDGRFQSNLAVAHGMKGEYDQALEAYAQVMPESDAHYNVAVLCESRNDHERAQAEYGQAMVLRVMARDTGTPTTGPAGASPEETSAPAPGQVVAQPTTPQPPDQAPPQSTTPPLTPSPDFGEPK